MKQIEKYQDILRWKIYFVTPAILIYGVAIVICCYTLKLNFGSSTLAELRIKNN
jgi:hypothetical protein